MKYNAIHSYEPELLCPYCDSVCKVEDFDYNDMNVHTCGNCNKSFIFKTDVQVDYSSYEITSDTAIDDINTTMTAFYVVYSSIHPDKSNEELFEIITNKYSDMLYLSLKEFTINDVHISEADCKIKLNDAGIEKAKKLFEKEFE